MRLEKIAKGKAEESSENHEDGLDINIEGNNWVEAKRPNSEESEGQSSEHEDMKNKSLLDHEELRKSTNKDPSDSSDQEEKSSKAEEMNKSLHEHPELRPSLTEDPKENLLDHEELRKSLDKDPEESGEEKLNKSLHEHPELRPSLHEDPEDSLEDKTDDEVEEKVFDDEKSQNKSLLEHEELRPSLCEDPEDSQEGDTDNEASDKVFDDVAEEKPEEKSLKIEGQPVSLNKGQHGCKIETKTEDQSGSMAENKPNMENKNKPENEGDPKKVTKTEEKDTKAGSQIRAQFSFAFEVLL